MFGAYRPFVFKNPIPGLTGDHVCGTRAEHGAGELLDVTLPPTIYLSSGIPLCCEPHRREVALLVGVGVRSTRPRSYVHRSTVTAFALVRSTARHSDPRRVTLTIPGGAPAIRTATLRSHPRHATVYVDGRPVTYDLSRDPRHAEVFVSADPESIYESIPPTTLDDWSIATGIHEPEYVGMNEYYPLTPMYTNCTLSDPALALPARFTMDYSGVGMTTAVVNIDVPESATYLMVQQSGRVSPATDDCVLCALSDGVGCPTIPPPGLGFPADGPYGALLWTLVSGDRNAGTAVWSLILNAGRWKVGYWGVGDVTFAADYLIMRAP